jgi:hypothetical protein
MNVYVFGNECVAEDKRAIEVARELDGTIEGISFVFVNPNEDAPFVNERHVVILDTVQGLRDVALVEGDAIDRLTLSPRGSVHDFDLGLPTEVPQEIRQTGGSHPNRDTARRRSRSPPYQVHLQEIGRTGHAGIVGAYDALGTHTQRLLILIQVLGEVVP